MNGDMGAASLHVVIADDHAVVRTGFRRLLELESGVQVVAEFDDGESACAWFSEHTADVLILDLSMPGRGGLATLQRLYQRRPALRVLVFTMHDSPVLAARALRAGACGYLTKDSPPQALVDAVLRVASGAQSVSDDVAAALACAPLRPHLQLSPREFDMFLLLAQGLTVDDIARQHCLSAKTVANYQTTIRRKMGAGNALDLYRYACAEDLLDETGEVSSSVTA